MMKRNLLFGTMIALLAFASHSQTVTDIDGNTYNTVTIGTQTWMKENLKTTHFNNGVEIATTSTGASNDPASVYQWPYEEDPANIDIYGRLYTWYVVDHENNVCPADWHVPSDSEWTELSNYLGGEAVAGTKMKEEGTTHWSVTDAAVDNSSGFTGLPGGFRGNTNAFNNISSMANFWSSTPFGSESFPRGNTFNLQSGSNALSPSVAVGQCGLSVRCVKDLLAGTADLFPEDKLRVFPNPATDQVKVSFEGIETLQMSIYDVAGALVFQQQLTNPTNLIDIEFLPQGIFIIKLAGGDLHVQRKLVKE